MPARRLAHSLKKWSPPTCPYESLIRLKSPRSTTSTMTYDSSCAACANSLPSSPWSARLWGRPVRESVKAKFVRYSFDRLNSSSNRSRSTCCPISFENMFTALNACGPSGWQRLLAPHNVPITEPLLARMGGAGVSLDPEIPRSLRIAPNLARVGCKTASFVQATLAYRVGPWDGQSLGDKKFTRVSYIVDGLQTRLFID